MGATKEREEEKISSSHPTPPFWAGTVRPRRSRKKRRKNFNRNIYFSKYFLYSGLQSKEITQITLEIRSCWSDPAPGVSLFLLPCSFSAWMLPTAPSSLASSLALFDYVNVIARRGGGGKARKAKQCLLEPPSLPRSLKGMRKVDQITREKRRDIGRCFAPWDHHGV